MATLPPPPLRPNEKRRRLLTDLLRFNKFDIRNDNDPFLKTFMGLVELGEVAVKEEHGAAAGMIYRRFTLTERGRKAAEKVATK